MSEHLSTGDQVPPVTAARLGAQGLAGPPSHDPVTVVRRLLAVQAQDLRGARLAIRTRSTGLTADDVDRALTDDRSLLITWLNRGTLHLIAAEDYWWLHPLTTPQLARANARRLEQEGVSPAQADAGVDVVREAVETAGPQTRARLRQRLDSAGIPTARQALVHVLMAATLRGDMVRGPMVAGEHAFVAARDWLGAPPEPLTRSAALTRLARRYLVGHGPADARDLAKWAGITLGDARLGLQGLVAELADRDDGLVDLADRAPTGELPGPRLLGPFDPLLLGWVSRAAIVGRHQHVVTTNGLFRPVALVDGHVVATWGLAGGVVSVRPLEVLSPAVASALDREATDVLRFVAGKCTVT
ncbi:winged helix DNA-binding domain-containing protein [Pengzhenrongella frigida]|uniref:Winged helix DNA-binding domain-containing protein n=1 Tax=Pengzhenrongella frigida TaxID=1259133 RepID=A0A4Q5N3Z3_9MICO|nr:winged helix DNA-binding domain-containing protein [Cellulomonas sp. HLT2-17]RYV52968.1 winged helix DNA-binding domain-containing protein [Cellulomonas sp. HLT2-17]